LHTKQIYGSLKNIQKLETNKSYLIKRLTSFKFAFNGIKLLFKNEANAKIHFLATVIVIIAGIIFKIKPIEWCVIIITISVVISAEGFNSAIEKLTDSIYKDKHDIAGTIKDIAAGAVLICAIGAAIIGIVIFLPYIINMLYSK
jgi:diacylglycerol kinase (ATP)